MLDYLYYSLKDTIVNLAISLSCYASASLSLSLSVSGKIQSAALKTQVHKEYGPAVSRSTTATKHAPPAFSIYRE